MALCTSHFVIICKLTWFFGKDNSVDYVAISIDFPHPDCLLPKASKPSALLFKRKIYAFPNEERTWAWLDSSIFCAENHCTTWTAFFSIYFPKKCWQIWIESIIYKKFFFFIFAASLPPYWLDYHFFSPLWENLIVKLQRGY